MTKIVHLQWVIHKILTNFIHFFQPIIIEFYHLGVQPVEFYTIDPILDPQPEGLRYNLGMLNYFKLWLDSSLLSSPLYTVERRLGGESGQYFKKY